MGQTRYTNVRWLDRSYASWRNEGYLQQRNIQLVDEEPFNTMQDPFLFQHNYAAELFIVRHADAIPEADEIIPSGIYDDLPLSRVGREQAQALAERLSSLNFDAIYSSPLRRCLETAEPLAERLGIQPIIAEDLRELKLGTIRPSPSDGNDLEALDKALQARQIDILRIPAEAQHGLDCPGSAPPKE